LDGREVSGYQVKMQSSGIMIEIPHPPKGLLLLKMIMKDGSVVTRKIIIR
jgi:2-keto-4-pentenoate hydratase